METCSYIESVIKDINIFIDKINIDIDESWSRSIKNTISKMQNKIEYLRARLSSILLFTKRPGSTRSTSKEAGHFRSTKSTQQRSSLNIQC